MYDGQFKLIIVDLSCLPGIISFSFGSRQMSYRLKPGPKLGAEAGQPSSKRFEQFALVGSNIRVIRLISTDTTSYYYKILL